MDWLSISVPVVGLLAPFAAKAGEAAARKIGEDVYDKLKAWFTKEGDKSAERVLSLYVEEPRVYEKTLQQALAEKAAISPDEFGAYLRKLAALQPGEMSGSSLLAFNASNVAQADRGSSAAVNVNVRDPSDKD